MRKYFNFFVLFLVIATSLRCDRKNPSELTRPDKQNDLYALRSEQLSNISYFLYFDIPSSESLTTGNVVLSFFLQNTQQPVILDFRNAEHRIKTIQRNEKDVPYRIENDHIILKASNFDEGENQLEISFIADTTMQPIPSNRLSAGALRPAGSLLFPCFDQTDLRASFLLNLQTPSGWHAASAGAILRARTNGDRQSVAFALSRIISPDAFRFVSGSFDTLSWQDESGKRIPILLPKNSSPAIREKALDFATIQHKLLQQTAIYLQQAVPFENLSLIFTHDNNEEPKSFPGLLIYPLAFLLDDSSTTQNWLQVAAQQSAKQWTSGLVSFTADRENQFADALARHIADKVLVINDLSDVLTPVNDTSDMPETKPTKAFQQLESMSASMGDSLFVQGLTSFFTTYSWGSASVDDFMREIELVGKQAL